MGFQKFALCMMCLGVMSHVLGADKPLRIIAEAEDFSVQKDSEWKAKPYRENYYASTFALTFLSRMGYLEAPEQVKEGTESVAIQNITVPRDGQFEVLIRYEQPYAFSAEFDFAVVQNGKVVWTEPFGRLDDVKIWGCSGSPEARRIPMPRFFWGATDNIVWQQGKTAAKLKAGKAELRLIVRAQKDGKALRKQVAKRNIDVVVLTDDTAGMEAQKNAPSSRTYLEFDGWMTQAGDVYVSIRNDGKEAITPTLVPFNNGQHSPYYVHKRDWNKSLTVYGNGYFPDATSYELLDSRMLAVDAKKLAPQLADAASGTKLAPNATSGWVPLGQLLDSLNNSTWNFNTSSPVTLTFGIPDGKGGIASVKTIALSSNTTFEMPGNIAPNPAVKAELAKKYWLPVIRTDKEALVWLRDQIKSWKPVGPAPKRFLVYNIFGFSNVLSRDDAVGALGREIATLLGDNTAVGSEKFKRDLVAHWPNPSLDAIQKNEAAYEKSGKSVEKNLRIVSYGDEKHLPMVHPSAEQFTAWMKKNAPEYNGPVAYNVKDVSDPLYYYSFLCAKEGGARQFAAATEYLGKKGVLTGTNYCPHSNYLVTELDYIRPFKLKAQSLAWSEDYVWQVPEFSIQAMGYLTSGLRAGAKYDNLPIHMYVMPHSPGNTARDFRLSYYTAIANGAREINYFCATPLAVGGTENYVDTNDLPMWKAIYDCTRAAGTFEDYVVDGQVRKGAVGLLLSSVDDIRGNYNNQSLAIHNNERKAVYYALRHAQIPVDFISEDDVISGLAKDYRVIYVTQRWLHSRAVTALKKWVEQGGTLVALAGGGFMNEFNAPNPDALALYGVSKQNLTTDPNLVSKYLLIEDKPFLTKQDLPMYEPIDTVTWKSGEQDVKAGVIIWKQMLTPSDAKVIGTYADGKPAAVVKAHGKGKAYLFGFLPGQAYLKSGLPLWPVDRSSHNEGFAHWLPTEMNPALRHALAGVFLPEGYRAPVSCDVPLIEVACIDTFKPARRIAIPVMNYTGKPLASIHLTVDGVKAAKKVRSVEQGELKPTFTDKGMTLELPLNITDMVLIDL